MWLCTQRGFFSIVQKQAGVFHVRARCEGELESLLEAAGLRLKVHVTPKADYRFRFICDQLALATIMVALAKDITYSNFKNRIHALPSQEPKSKAYGKLWYDLYALQHQEHAD